MAYLPSWFILLEMAEAWGCKPWELEVDEDFTKEWWDRYMANREARARKERKEQKEIEAKLGK